MQKLSSCDRIEKLHGVFGKKFFQLFRHTLERAGLDLNDPGLIFDIRNRSKHLLLVERFVRFLGKLQNAV